MVRCHVVLRYVVVYVWQSDPAYSRMEIIQLSPSPCPHTSNNTGVDAFCTHVSRTTRALRRDGSITFVWDARRPHYHRAPISPRQTVASWKGRMSALSGMPPRTRRRIRSSTSVSYAWRRARMRPRLLSAFDSHGRACSGRASAARGGGVYPDAGECLISGGSERGCRIKHDLRWGFEMEKAREAQGAVPEREMARACCQRLNSTEHCSRVLPNCVQLSRGASGSSCARALSATRGRAARGRDENVCGGVRTRHQECSSRARILSVSDL